MPQTQAPETGTYTDAQLSDGTTLRFIGDLNPDQVKQKVAAYRLKTGSGMMENAQRQATAAATRPIDKAAETNPSSDADSSNSLVPLPTGGTLGRLGRTFIGATPVVGKYLYGPTGNPVTSDDRKSLLKADLATAGAVVAPEILPSLGGFTGMLTRSAAVGAGAGLGTSAGQVAAGENPMAPAQLRETGRTALVSGAVALPGEGLETLSTAKLGRAAINESMGATARDVTYGNPALGIAREGINTPVTGDIEKYKAALRAGKSVAEAEQRAGGRIAAVSRKLNELAPQLQSALQNARTPVSVATAIDQPLNSAANEIISNAAMTQAEKDAAINQLGELQRALHDGAQGASHISAADAHRLKQLIGDRVDWKGTTAVTDEVKPAYRAVYGSLKNAVHAAAPGAAQLDERLTNLLAAKGDLIPLSKAQEVGRGTGPLRATTGRTLLGGLQSVAGSALPAVSRIAPRIARAAGPRLGPALLDPDTLSQ